MSEKVCLLNMKGGVGKTTIAVSLAWHMFKERKKRVLLVDFDPQFNLSQYLMKVEDYEDHKKTKGTIANLLIEVPDFSLDEDAKEVEPKDVVKVIKHESSTQFLHLLPSEDNLSYVVKHPSDMHYKLFKIFEKIGDSYDYIFVDCAPTDSILTTMALTACNFVLVPIRPDSYSIIGLGLVKKAIKRFLKDNPNHSNVRSMGIVFSQVMPGSEAQAKMVSEITEVARIQGEHVFSSKFTWSNTFMRALINSTPVQDTKYAQSKLKISISGVGEEMVRRIAQLKKS